MALAARFSPRLGLALTLVWVALLALTGAEHALLFLAPALLIAIPLLGGHYVGEELIARLVRRRRRPRPARALVARRVAPAPAAPRGAALLALGLAVRPPPRFGCC
ncbi:MAG TPA: hypothetical protein VFB52_04205 [Solirubrobacterales bacterium]|nr:hypothetical protein [Solirubrobacterales bacterium]